MRIKEESAERNHHTILYGYNNSRRGQRGTAIDGVKWASGVARPVAGGNAMHLKLGVLEALCMPRRNPYRFNGTLIQYALGRRHSWVLHTCNLRLPLW